MTPRNRADWDMIDDLVARAGTRTPDYVDEVLAATARVHQRPAWTFPSRWVPAVGPMGPVLRFAMLAALLGVALLGALLVGAGSRFLDSRPVPPPAVVATPSAPAATPAAGVAYEACAAAATNPITITAWDQESGVEVSATIDELNDEFEAANPGVTIAREQKAAEDLATALEAALADPAGPDVVQVDRGREGMGAAVRAGLLLPLTDAAAEHGWADRWAPGILARSSYGDDGRTPGTDTLYGVALTGEVVGGFFNLDLASQRPARPYPESLEGEMADWAAMKEAGHVPIVLGAADGGAVPLYGLLLNAMAEPGWSDALVYGRSGATFATPEAVAAAAMLVEMGDRGFFTDDYAAIGHDEAVRRFLAGGGEFLWTGSWDALAIGAGQPGALFTEPTPATPDGQARALGGVGMPWSVRRTTANPGCAVAYLDFLTGDHAAQLLAARGVLPSHYEFGAPLPGRPSVGSGAYQDMATIFREASASGRLDHRLEELFPAAAEVFRVELARLMAKETSPEQFVEAIEAAYRAYLTTLE